MRTKIYKILNYYINVANFKEILLDYYNIIIELSTQKVRYISNFPFHFQFLDVAVLTRIGSHYFRWISLAIRRN